MAKSGSPHVGPFLVGGRSILGEITEIDGPHVENLTEETTVLGVDWQEHEHVGMSKGSLGFNGFYNDREGGANEALLANLGGYSVACLGLRGNVAGRAFVGWAGVCTGKFSRLPVKNELVKGNGTLGVTGAVDEGFILQPLATKTATWDTEDTESVDHGALTAAGGAGYLQVADLVGYTSLVGKVRHSADDVTYADLATFPTVAAAPAALRVAVAAGVTINRHLAFSGALTGATDGAVDLLSSSQTDPTEVTTDGPHGLQTGDAVVIAGHDADPDINGVHVVTVTGTDTFTVPVEVTTAGTAVGTVTKVTATAMAGFARYA